MLCARHQQGHWHQPGARQHHRHRARVPAGSSRCRAAGAPASAAATAEGAQRPKAQQLLYEGVALDMDGTLTSCIIDFQDMRKRTGIPVGDLFVAMESWEEPERVKASMDVILELEEAASANISAKEGLLELLGLLRDSQARVALVTRNTNQSVDAFFGLVGDEWRGLFSEIRTREFKYCKPDKRLLLELAETWGIHPGKLLMVGDSHEDVECGNAAGTATCLLAGGGNEVGGPAAPPPGAVPTFSVRSLPELTRVLLDTAPSPPSSLEAAADSSSSASSGSVGDALRSIEGLEADSIAMLGWPLRSLASTSSTDSDDDDAAAAFAAQLLLDPCAPGAPAPGLDFFDALVELGAIQTATTSFPRMGAAAGGLAACEQGVSTCVVHVGCGDGSLTKMLASKGLRVWGVDADVSAATQRGLSCVPFQGTPLAEGSLAAAAAATASAAAGSSGVDAVVVYTSSGSSTSALVADSSALTPSALAEMGRLLQRGGRLCVEVPLAGAAAAAAGGGGEQERLRGALGQARYGTIACCQVLPGWAGQQPRVRLVAEWSGH